QQHLVALGAKIGLARRFVDDDPAVAARVLEELRADVRAIGAELRDLAHGIYPPLLRDQGLAEALRTAAARLSPRCSVEVTALGRYPEPVETAVYFCCLEAMANAIKHAGPDAVIEVSLGGTAGGDGLSFTVADDGAGFEAGSDAAGAAARAGGTGLVNMADRLGAVGGRVAVESIQGAGTTVRGMVG
ncbi:MAG: sensor histidine kinase, partial [Frankia sp.]